MIWISGILMASKRTYVNICGSQPLSLVQATVLSPPCEQMPGKQTNLRSYLSQTDQTLDFSLHTCFSSWNSLSLWISPRSLCPLNQMSGHHFLSHAWVMSILSPQELVALGPLHHLLPGLRPHPLSLDAGPLSTVPPISTPRPLLCRPHCHQNPLPITDLI